jgi:hypothetical protein
MYTERAKKKQAGFSGEDREMPSKSSDIDLPESTPVRNGEGPQGMCKIALSLPGIRLVLACISIYQISRITGMIMGRRSGFREG